VHLSISKRYLPKIHTDTTRIVTDISYVYLKKIHTDMHTHMRKIQQSAYRIYSIVNLAYDIYMLLY
jgi:hypothetical protein